MMPQPGAVIMPQQMQPQMPQPIQSDQQFQHFPQQPWMMVAQQVQPQPPPPPVGFVPPPVAPPTMCGAAPPPAPAPVIGQCVGDPSEIKSLWIGDLQPWMDETYIYNIFSRNIRVVSTKIIRNKTTNASEGYGFVEFMSRADAELILKFYNGTTMPNSDQHFRMNWATLAAGDKRQIDGPDYTIFVGDLAADVSDYQLQETFKSVYPSVKGAKVVTDRITGRSKGYGFVRFGDESEKDRAMHEMNGQYCSNRSMRIGPAATKKLALQQLPKVIYQDSQANQGESDPNNTTVFVGALDSSVSDEDLRFLFGQYGELVHVKIPPGKRCGFVQFADRTCAEQALANLNGTKLANHNIRLSWGRSPSNKQAQAEQPQWNGEYYGYPQSYDAYGYPQNPQDPNMYYGGAYYGNYQQPSQ